MPDPLLAEIEAVRTDLAAIRDRIEEWGIRGVLDPAAGGVTCVIAALHCAQEHLTDYRVRVPGGDIEGTAHPSAPNPPHPGDVWVEWDDDERGWYDADTVERIPEGE